MVKRSREDQIRDFFMALFHAWGRQHWWPADSPFEVIVGAFLTQNTAWTNVELALANLRAAGVLTLSGIRDIPIADLEQLIRPSGYFRQKAQSLKTFIAYLDLKYAGSLEEMLARPTVQLRTELLSLNGIGTETADSILLYAGNHEVFVVDAYARRILERHLIISESAKYEDVRELMERALTSDFAAQFTTGDVPHTHPKPPGAHHHPSTMSTVPRSARAQLFNEMHGLIVGIGKNYCQSRRALCEECPLKVFLKAPVRIKAPR